jgi:glutamyl-tRNA reductase
MPLQLIGVNHRTAPLSVRERAALSAEELPETLQHLRGLPHVRGIAIVSTCNRFELYADAADPTALDGWLGERLSAHASRLDPAHIYRFDGDTAVTHAYRVAAGLDSMILGEAQILGQFKQAYLAAQSQSVLSPLLDRMFQNALATAKSVRTQTAIGESSVSLAAAALKVANRIFDSLDRRHVLLVGVGEMVELAATHFAAAKPAGFTVVNRTLANAQALAERLGSPYHPLTALPDLLPKHDIVIAGTGSVLPIIGKGMVERAMRQRRHQPMLLLDFAVPRDVEPEVSQIEDAFVFTVDDLGKLAQQGVERRQAAQVEAEALIAQATAEFAQWQESRRSVSAIVTLRARGEHYRSLELDRARRLLAGGATPEAALEALARALTNKLLHHPTDALNRAAAHERDDLAAAIARLYPPLEPGEIGDPHSQ